jgi:hypothetical protein
MIPPVAADAAPIAAVIRPYTGPARAPAAVAMTNVKALPALPEDAIARTPPHAATAYRSGVIRDWPQDQSAHTSHDATAITRVISTTSPRPLVAGAGLEAMTDQEISPSPKSRIRVAARPVKAFSSIGRRPYD